MSVAPATLACNPPHYTQGPVHCIDAMVSAFGKDEVENFCTVCDTSILVSQTDDEACCCLPQ
eukprot:SAG25_NODE_6236_length_576_cov_0.966457_1_plen_61_part_10